MENYKDMTAKEMDIKMGVKNRMKKVANNLRKFGQLDGQSAPLRDYHMQMKNDGLDKIADIGVRDYCNDLGEMCGVSMATVKSDYAIMKRYGLIL